LNREDFFREIRVVGMIREKIFREMRNFGTFNSRKFLLAKISSLKVELDYLYINVKVGNYFVPQ